MIYSEVWANPPADYFSVQTASFELNVESDHNVDVIQCSDWIIALGPDDVDKGGDINVVHTPVTVPAQPASPEVLGRLSGDVRPFLEGGFWKMSGDCPKSRYRYPLCVKHYATRTINLLQYTKVLYWE